MSGSMTADIVSIHESHRTDAQNELINAAADVAYEMQEATGFVVLAWDANKEFVVFKMDGDLSEYAADTVKRWVRDE